jgi:hypothetical protein
MAWNGNIVQSLVFCLVSCRSLSVLFSLFVWLLFHDIVLFIVSHYPFGIFKLCISRGRESENLGKIGKMFVSALFSIFWQLLRHFCRTRPIILAFLHGIEACPSILYVLDNIVHIFYMCCQLLFGGVCDLFSPYYLFFSSLFLQNFEWNKFNH